jgi:hypothetical protein
VDSGLYKNALYLQISVNYQYEMYTQLKIGNVLIAQFPLEMKAHVYFGTAFEELAQYGVLSIDSCL